MRDYFFPHAILFIFCLHLIAEPTSTTAPANDEPLNALKAGPNDVHGLLIDEAEQIYTSGKNDFKLSAGTRVMVCTSREIVTDFPFNELIPSWNIDMPRGTGFTVYVRVGQKGDWTPFFYFGSWGQAPPIDQKVIRDAKGTVNIDHFQSTELFEHIQYRIEYAPKAKQSRPIHRFTMAYSNTLNDENLARHHRHSIDPGPQKRWARRLPVPFMSQISEDPEIRGQICSPVSVAMVLDYWGVRFKNANVRQAVWDPEYKIYGNWSRAIEAAYTFGLAGYLERFDDWNQVKRYIAADQALIASVKIAKGQLRSDPDRQSSGHLLVIAGFDEQGNVYVNDPAYRNTARGRTIYSQKEMEDIWLANGGLGYVFRAVGFPLKQ